LYIILFLEGIITFISPCLLPLLPVYVSYYAGGEAKKGKVLKNSLGFVLGFTVVFVALGAFAGAIGSFFLAHGRIVNLVTGGIVILIGLNFLGVVDLPIFRGRKGLQLAGAGGKVLTFPGAVAFGVVFSVAWMPCVSTFLGAALVRASQQGSVIEGMTMLFIFSMGLGLPFIICSLLIDQLKGAFAFIKRNYRFINILAGGLLVVMGILMMMGRLLI